MPNILPFTLLGVAIYRGLLDNIRAGSPGLLIHTSKAQLSSILYYITGHGFGHTVRSVQVIRALKRSLPELSIYVRSTAPEWLVQHTLFPVQYSRQSLDAGIVQTNSLKMDLGKTLRACQALHAEAPALIQQERDFIRYHKIQLIVGDIPALCFEIAAQTSRRSVAISNFTWSWIYRAYLNDHPHFLPIIEKMDGFYRKTTLALTLPCAGGMEVFPLREPIPWISRMSALSKDEARERFNLPRAGTMVLLSFGGLGLSGLSWSRLKQSKDFFFVATGASETVDGNVFILPDAQHHYEDLVRAADVIVTKPGYGIVADVLAHRVRILYTDRGDFAEYPRLVQVLTECATAEYVPQKELLSGDFLSYLTSLLEKKPNWPDVRLDGAQIAAEKVLAILNGHSAT
ncbi:MAG: glycosyltransferase family protein [Candidatus Binatia bacterium]